VESVFPQPAEFFEPDDGFFLLMPPVEKKQNQMQRVFF
jgi:hypothetical protein